MNCADCNKVITSANMAWGKPLCFPCGQTRLHMWEAKADHWIMSHSQTLGLTGVPLDVVKYCSQAFVDINNYTYGYKVAQRWGEDSKTLKVTDFTILDEHNQEIFDDIVPKMLKQYSGKDFIILEIHQEDPVNKPNGSVMNMAVHWDIDNDVIRTILSDALAGYVTSTTGYLRPDYSNSDGWDTFESE